MKRLAGGELYCVAAETACGHEDPTVSAFGRNDPEQLSDALDRDLSIQPVLALNNHAFAAAGELEVDAAIRLASARSFTE